MNIIIYAVFLCSLANPPPGIRPNVCGPAAGAEDLAFTSLAACEHLARSGKPAQGFRFVCMKREVATWELAQ